MIVFCDGARGRVGASAAIGAAADGEAAPRIEIGLRIPSGDPPDPDDLRAFVQRAEALGFSSIWVGDHVYHHTDVLQPLDLLSWVAGLTERVRLGTAVVLAAYLHPVLLAKSAATVDLLSGGRLTLGVALGGTPEEFAGLGVPVQQRLGRLLENVAIVRRLWREDGVEHVGRYHRITGASVRPKPIQDPLPVYFAGRSEAMLNRLALLADGWVASSHYTTEQFLQGITTIRERARAGGRDPDRLGYTKVQAVSVHRDPHAARERARLHWQRYYGPSFDVDHSVIHGTPDRCAAALARFGAVPTRDLTLILEPTSLEVSELDLLWSTARQAVPESARRSGSGV